MCLAALVAMAALLAVGHLFVAQWAALAGYAALFLPWAGLIILSRTGESERPEFKWSHLIAAAVLARVVFLFAEPVLSDDIFRYIWDGRVAFDGINPYLHAPDAQALTHLRDLGVADAASAPTNLWEKINHPQVPTIYPPVAQILFWLNAALGGGTVLLRVLLLACEAATAGLLWLVLTRTAPAMSSEGLKRAFVAYALCPLVIVETAWSGHIDVLAWMPLVVALVLMTRAGSLRAAALAGVLFGVSVAAKFLGLIALALVLFARRAPFETSLGFAARRRAVFAAIAAVTIAACYLPYLDAGPRLFSGFGTYASTWQGNDGPFRAMTYVSEESLARWAPTGNTTIDDTRVTRLDDKLIFTFPQYDELFTEMGWTRTWQGMEVPSTSFAADQIAQTIAKALAASLVGLAMLWALLVRREPIGGTLLVLLTLFFVAPVVHPWYVAWLVPLAALQLAALQPAALQPAALRGWKTAMVFAFVVLAAYVGWVSAQAGGSWQVPHWMVAVEFGLVTVVAFWEAVEA
jgi:hypothetical protein